MLCCRATIERLSLLMRAAASLLPPLRMPRVVSPRDYLPPPITLIRFSIHYSVDAGHYASPPPPFRAQHVTVQYAIDALPPPLLSPICCCLLPCITLLRATCCCHDITPCRALRLRHYASCHTYATILPPLCFERRRHSCFLLPRHSHARLHYAATRLFSHYATCYATPPPVDILRRCCDAAAELRATLPYAAMMPRIDTLPCFDT